MTQNHKQRARNDTMKPLRILLADDSQAVGSVLADQLRSNGHQVACVQSGEAAVAAFLDNPPELILMDIEMPGIGGLEAIRRIRRIPSPLRVPIIIITAHTDEANLLSSFMAGADDFLAKPIQPLLLDVRIQAMMRLIATQRSTAAMIDSVAEGIIRIDRRGRITAFNKAAERIFGYGASEVLDQNVSMLMPPPFRDEHDTYLGNYVATGQRKVIGSAREVVGLRKNGEIFPMSLGVSEVEAPDEHFFVGIVRDLSIENELRTRLRESRNFLADIIENIPAATYVKNREGQYVLVNRQHEVVTGRPREQLLGKTDADIFPPDAARAYRQLDLEVMAGNRTIEAEEKLTDAHGERHFLSIKFPTRDAAGNITGICGISPEITELKKTQHALERLSQYDDLTGLYNRRHFMSLAQQEFGRSRRYGTPLTLLMLDIDHFKRINDTYGHPAGDQVLKAIGRLIHDGLRGIDIAGRLGGEEFAVMLPETTIGQAIMVAERLRGRIVSAPLSLNDGQSVACTLSIGIAMLSAEADHLDRLLQQADQALYAAKERGRNRVVSYVADRPA